MAYLICTLLGLVVGVVVVFALLEGRRRRAKEDLEEARELRRSVEAQRSVFHEERRRFDNERGEFGTWSVSIRQLEGENRQLKQDLLNIGTSVRKLQVDRRLQADHLAALDRRGQELAEQYLDDVEKWVGASINANNYTACKQRLVKAIGWARELGFQVTEAREAALLERLKAEYEMEVRAVIAREEQARIKAQIREEQAREREIQKELDAIERERAAVEAALKAALAHAGLAQAGEIERLKLRLAEAEAKGQRALAQAQLTRAGHLYVISNIGAFGEGVVKIGMTRRLEPLDRVQELGDASVPFPFDVHMMIACDDVPALENALHREFAGSRINKVNPKKEFFRVDLQRVRAFIEARHGEVKFVADAEALQYRQSLTMSEEDQRYIEEVFERADAQAGSAIVED